jgi:hypothetical protein
MLLLTELRVFMCMNRLMQVSSSSMPDMDFCKTQQAHKHSTEQTAGASNR